MGYLTGTEVSVSFAGETVHIIGLGFDATDAALLEGLAATRGGRLERAQQMADGLAAAGIPGAFEGALRYVGNPELISRTHFGRFLVDTGVCPDMNSVFRRYLTQGHPGYVPHRWARLADAVRWITQAGGVAVIAHPARYRFTPTEEYALITEFIAHGGRGLEVMSGSHSHSEQVKYAATALEFDLLASRGSDFHSPTESRVELGSLPDLPGTLRPVWEALQHRIQRATRSTPA
jgi:predicted metal-dependent phosphoesterase TrpH